MSTSVKGAVKPAVEASSSLATFEAAGVQDGDRFSTQAGRAWKGKSSQSMWWWQIHFPQPRQIGSILQIIGDHETVLQNAPRRYMWRWSNDGKTWHNLLETQTMRERRLFRIHRLKKPVTCRYLRIEIFDCTGAYPTLREVEVYPRVEARIDFADWIVAVSIVESSKLSGAGRPFITLARKCQGWENVPAQNIWMGDFDESYIAVEPYPLCAFFGASGREWCQRMHEPFKGVEEVFNNRNLPMWTACGSAQLLALISTVGVDAAWDCPRCRDPKNPKSPVYTHIGFKNPDDPGLCGEYTKNIKESGPTYVAKVLPDPVFDGLPQEFQVPEAHIGQIAFIPKGWKHLLTAGKDGMTKMQCMRIKDRCIYAAQFHIEKSGTPENSQKIMSNFLKQARKSGGYRAKGAPVPSTSSREK